MTETSWGREEEEVRLWWEVLVLTGEEEIEKSLFCFTSTVAAQPESASSVSSDLTRNMSRGFIETD